MRKLLVNGFIVLGFILLAGVFVARFMGRPGAIMGFRLLTLVIFSNTAFLLAILLKLCEKK